MDRTLVIPVELKNFLGFKQIISIQIQNIQKAGSKYKLIFEIVALELLSFIVIFIYYSCERQSRLKNSLH